MPSTLFLSVSDVRRLIKQVGLNSFIRLLADRIHDDFIRWPEFQKSARTANHSKDGVIELMPTSDGKYFSFKYVNGHPKNFHIGLPTVMGFGCLASVSDGWPLLISEMTVLTGIRTASTSAMAAQALAIPVASTMAMIGNGAQSEFQILAFLELLAVNEVRLYDIDPSATQKLIHNLKDVPGLELTISPSVESAVKGAHIVTTSTAEKTHAQILTPEMIEPGMHINAVGGDCPGKTELHPDILDAAKVFVEFSDQTWVEGEIQQMATTLLITELWQVLSGAVPGRSSLSDVTVFDSVGFSIEDFSTLTLIYELARASGIGTEIELIPDLKNVKDLYAALVG